MALELPICTAAISRLEDVKLNLAAMGIVSALALFVQSPVLRIMSLPLMMIKGGNSFYALRNFVVIFCLIISGFFFAIAIDPIFGSFIVPMLGLNQEIAKLVQSGLLIWCVYPIVIGLRRFYQGILLCAHEPKKIAISTFVRLISILILISIFSYCHLFSGVIAGVVSIGIGMAFEMLLSMWFARVQIAKYLKISEDESKDFRFFPVLRTFLPLSFSSTVTMSSGPILSFFTTKGMLPVESLALSPVLFGILNPFTWSAFSIQDTTQTLLNKDLGSRSEVRKFSIILGVSLSILFLIVALTPISNIYFLEINHLSDDLLSLTKISMLIMSTIPIGFTLKNFYRGSLIADQKLKFLFVSEFFEIICLTIVFSLLLRVLNIPGIYLLFMSFTLSGYINLTLLWFKQKKQLIRS